MSANLLSRRALLAAAAAVPALKTAKAAGPLERVDLLIDWKPAPTYAGFYVARESGAFERRGLDVRIAEGRGASISTEVIGAGQEHWIGSASGAATAIGRSKGQPVKSLAVYYHDTPTVLYSRTEKPIAAPQDLYGKKIGLVSGSITVEEYRGFLAANKLKRSKITELAVGRDATPLLSGEVDGLIDYAEITPTELTAQGHRITTLRFADFGVRAYSLNLIVNEAAWALSARRKTARKIVGAVREGYQFVRDRPAEAAKIFSRLFPDQPVSYLGEAMPIVARELGRDVVGSQTRKGWQQTISTMAALKLLARPVTIDEVAV
jgi:ABC-type nitrate/sulfonate/bicarbonate transport system substrate-binding protein